MKVFVLLLVLVVSALAAAQQTTEMQKAIKNRCEQYNARTQEKYRFSCNPIPTSYSDEFKLEAAAEKAFAADQDKPIQEIAASIAASEAQTVVERNGVKRLKVGQSYKRALACAAPVSISESTYSPTMYVYRYSGETFYVFIRGVRISDIRHDIN